MRVTGLILKAAMLSTGILLLDMVGLWLLGLWGKARLADVLFVEGAVLMVISGMKDFSRSLTMANIRHLFSRRGFHTTIRSHSHSAGALVLLLSGIFLCIQAVFVIPLLVGS